MTERPTALTRAHRAIEEMAGRMYGGDPSQSEILACVATAMNPPVYPEPTDDFTFVAVSRWADGVYQRGLRNAGLVWSHVATGTVVEWWEICEKGKPLVLMPTPIKGVIATCPGCVDDPSLQNCSAHLDSHAGASS